MKKAASLLCLAVLFLMLGGCQMIRIEEENKTPLAYTVIEDSQIPEEMQELIREKKETEFQIAYQKGTELFLAKGYGRQMSGEPSYPYIVIKTEYRDGPVQFQ